MGLGASSRQTLVLATGVSGGLLIGAQFARWSSADEALGLFRNDHPRIASDELRSGYERRESVMAVLNQVDALGLGPKIDKTRLLICDTVRAVVDHDIELAQRAEERRIGLVANMYLETGLLEVALRIDIDPNDFGALTKILFPDLERSAMVDADF